MVTLKNIGLEKMVRSSFNQLTFEYEINEDLKKAIEKEAGKYQWRFIISRYIIKFADDLLWLAAWISRVKINRGININIDQSE